MLRELLVLHHTHTDIGYTHPQPVIWELHDRHLDEALDLCEATADWPEPCRLKWTCEVTCTLLHWLDRAPAAQVRRLQALVRHGQVGFGAMWCNWTGLAPEDLLQESLAPLERLRAQFGDAFDVAIQHDVNGVPWSVADQLLDAGIPNLLFGINIHMGGYPLTRPLLFRWAAPGGRTVTVFSGEHYNALTREAGLREPDLDRMERGLRAYAERLRRKGWTRDLAVLTVTHPFMDDNNPPYPGLPGLVRRWNEAGRLPFIRLVTAGQLFERLHALDDGTLPVHGGDWPDYWAFGAGAAAREVGMVRRAQGAWWTARALGAALPPSAAATGPTNAETLRHLMLAYEHTWNVFSSTAAFGPTREHEPVPEAEQRHHKAAICAGALSYARLQRRDALDRLAENPVQAAHNAGLLVFNPADAPCRVCLRVPNEILLDQLPLLAGTKQRPDVLEDLHRDGSTTWVGPLDLPPFGLYTARLEDLPRAAPDPGVRAGPDSVESPAWTLRFDPATGAIRSLRHRATERECFADTAGWDLFGAVQETVATRSAASLAAGDPRYDLFQITEADYGPVHRDECCWNRAWPARHARPERFVRCATHVDAEGAHLVRVFLMPGVRGELRQTFTLLAHEPRVRCEAYFNKADDQDPEALYFTFPLRLPGARLHYDTAGQAVAYDAGQLPGACRDWIPAGTWVAAVTEAGCLALACPDAPLFQVGGFQFGRGLRSAEGLDQAFLLAWPLNNYWNTNFAAAQPGYVRFRYELAWFDRFDAAACARFGAGALRPPVYHPLAAAPEQPRVRALFEVSGESVTVAWIKPEGNGVEFGLRNHAAATRRVRVGATETVIPGRRVGRVHVER